jgi:hypothetical protein
LIGRPVHRRIAVKAPREIANRSQVSGSGGRFSESISASQEGRRRHGVEKPLRARHDAVMALIPSPLSLDTMLLILCARIGYSPHAA